jgi:hypothetical protein
MSKKGVKLEGLNELYKLMDGIPNQVKAKALQSIGKSVLRKTMRNTLESKHQKMTKIGNERRSPTGVLFGFMSRYNFMNWFEYGTDQRTRDSGGATGKMNPKPFWGKHLNRNINTTIKTYFKDYEKLLGRFIKRNIRKTNKSLGL